METIISGVMALVLLLFGGLLLAGSRAFPRETPDLEKNDPRAWPEVALLAPVTGAAKDLAANLNSLLSQDYPDYRAVFITRGPEDPATPAIRALIKDRPRAGLVMSGPATSCGQKNYNLLAGLRALGRYPEVLVFCDGTHLAPSTWLKDLVLPLVTGDAGVVSGYHHVLPGDGSLAAWGRAVTVLILYLTRGVPGLNQPWGGATAIKSGLFENLGVKELWSRTVVDDVTLAALLQARGLPAGLAPGADLLTPLSGETLAGWRDWLTRQWLYLKFCLPGTWVAAGVFLILLPGLALLSGMALLGFLAGFSKILAWSGAVYLAALTSLVVLLKAFHPRPPKLRTWLPAAGAAMGMAAWCHLRTWRAREIHWRGISYRVGPQGIVEEVLTN
jgi:hypothetical protein